jgi:hypothetical protein
MNTNVTLWYKSTMKEIKRNKIFIFTGDNYMMLALAKESCESSVTCVNQGHLHNGNG